MVVSKKSSTFAPSNKNKQQFKTITTMTKEELAQKIAQCEYKECRRDGNYSVTFKIGDMKASATKIGNSIVAMTVISTDISEEDYKKILKQALYSELAIVRQQEKELTESINKI